MNTKPTSNPPVDKIRVGNVTVSIWRNSSDKGVFYNTSLELRYKDKDGNWKTGESYNPSDLLALAKAADLAHTKILDLLKGSRKKPPLKRTWGSACQRSPHSSRAMKLFTALSLPPRIVNALSPLLYRRMREQGGLSLSGSSQTPIRARASRSENPTLSDAFWNL